MRTTLSRAILLGLLGVTSCAGDKSTPSTGSGTLGSTSNSSTGGASTGGAATGVTSTAAPTSGSTGPACMDGVHATGGPQDCGGEELALKDPCDQLAGYESCPDGSVHRHTQVACNVREVYDPCVDWDDLSSCKEDAHCVDFASGFCEQAWLFDGGRCECVYPCTTDDECGPGGACVCPLRGPTDFELGLAYQRVAACMPANCRTDADCPGTRCAVSVGGCYDVEGLYCHTPEDECEGHADCPGGGRCAYSTDMGRWICDNFSFCE